VPSGVRYNHVVRRFVILGLVAALALIAAVLLYASYATLRGVQQRVPGSRTPHPHTLSAGWAEDNMREVQMKLREGGFYSAEIDGVYSSELAAALTRYQIRNGLPITGQLDVDTSKALDAKPAVAASTGTREQSSETWRRLRKGDQQTPNTAQITPTLGRNEAIASANGAPPQKFPSLAAPIPNANPASAPAVRLALAHGSSANGIGTERVRDYVGAFVLAGLDPQVGAEAEFFADRVQYYDEGTIGRENIRRDLQRYAARWPERRFWLAGDIRVEPQNGNRVRVTFPLRYDVRKGAKHKSGKINKTLVLEPAGNDLEIVAVNERKAN
jgi:peptidoglycan hydrolase-like protein with peptidoglycan-binding domain